MNLPFTGIATFAKVPYAPDLETLDADVAVIGAPYDLGTQVRSGTRLGPRGIRNASTIYGMRTPRYYDAEFDEIYLDGVRIVDCGDVDMLHGDPRTCLDNIQTAIGAILARGALPVTLGGDHAVPIPILRATATPASTASASCRSTRTSTSSTSASACGRATATSCAASPRCRTPAASRRSASAARARPTRPTSSTRARMGSVIIGPRRFRELGVAGVLAQIPRADRYYVTIDCDGFDPALMPGNGSPSPGGLTYHEGVDLLRGIAELGDVVGFDFVEVAPMYDPTEITQQTAARIVLDFLGAIFKARERRAAG